MKPNHVHLHVRDLAASVRFYKRWFGLVDGPDHGDLVFLRSREGFDLALSRDPDPAPLPDWFHWGFKLESRDTVRALFSAMQAADVPIVKDLGDFEDVALFRCADPDGHRVELYWE